MRLIDYVKDHIMLLLLQAVCMGGSFFYLHFCGVNAGELTLLYLAWIAMLLGVVLTGWWKRSRYFNEMDQVLKLLDKPYLLSEVMPRSYRLEDKRYREFLRFSNKGMIDEVHRLEKEQEEYKEFIENWVHEVKLPITTMQLICGNLMRQFAEEESEDWAEEESEDWKETEYSGLESTAEYSGPESTAEYSGPESTAEYSGPENAAKYSGQRHLSPKGGIGERRKLQIDSVRSLTAQLARVESDVETALFYARSDTVYQDYMIKELLLGEPVREAISRSAPYLKRCNVCVESALDQERVYSDGKWLEFILGQLLANAVKYRRPSGCRIRIYAQREEQGIRLTVEDNGTGIPANELDRIFDKGFTGSNGRNTRQSTGIGLYLCRKLCGKLGIAIDAQSEEGSYTRIRLFFPDGSSHFSRK